MAINAAVGSGALRGAGPKFSLGWNSFVATAGPLLPVVWPLFLSKGLATWPYIAIFLWFGIFACELTGFAASATWFLLVK